MYLVHNSIKVWLSKLKHVIYITTLHRKKLEARPLYTGVAKQATFNGSVRVKKNRLNWRFQPVSLF